jgi:hypothetical protein
MLRQVFSGGALHHQIDAQLVPATMMGGRALSTCATRTRRRLRYGTEDDGAGSKVRGAGRNAAEA